MDDSDPDLAEAIKRSLNSEHDVNPSELALSRKKKPEIIVVDDEEDEDGNNAKTVKDKERSGGPVKPPAPRENTQIEKDVKGRQSSLLGLDRAEMERQRLARRKRAGDAEPAEEEGGSKLCKTIRQSSPYQEKSRGTTTQDLAFPSGAVRKTYIANAARGADDITIEEIFQKSTLKKAVLSAFQWDFLWVFGKLHIGRTELVLVVQAKEPEQKEEYQRNLRSVPKTRLVFPNMSGQINCMHSKLQLLFHECHLRISIPTANLVPYDWGEAGGIMENSVFVIDLPKKNEATVNIETFFMKELVYFCKAKGIPSDIINDMTSNYDFSPTRSLGFVHSIGGGHSGDLALKTGVCALARTVRLLQLKAKKAPKVDYVTSSLGSLNKEFLLTIYRAAQGENGWKRVKLKSKSAKTKKTVETDDDTTDDSESSEEEDDDSAWKNISSLFRIYFPSKRTVAASKGGTNCGGTICFQERWFKSPNFPSNLLRDCQSTRTGMLMHNKIMFVRPSKVGKHNGWAYIGSANLSESAWGRLIAERSTKQPRINLRNWECGVIIPVGVSATPRDTIPKIFEEIIPVPMVTDNPPPLSEANPPWYFNSVR